MKTEFDRLQTHLLLWHHICTLNLSKKSKEFFNRKHLVIFFFQFLLNSQVEFAAPVGYVEPERKPRQQEQEEVSPVKIDTNSSPNQVVI